MRRCSHTTALHSFRPQTPCSVEYGMRVELCYEILADQGLPQIEAFLCLSHFTAIPASRVKPQCCVECFASISNGNDDGRGW